SNKRTILAATVFEYSAPQEVHMNDDSFLYLNYKRFFAVFLSVLPGVVLVYGMGSLAMVILDLVRAPLGWCIFAGVVTAMLFGILGFFLGLIIQEKMKPAEPHT